VNRPAPPPTRVARRCAEKFGLDDLRLSPELLARLGTADWPGNVRQLENTIARLAALSTGGLIEAAALDGTSSAPVAEHDGPAAVAGEGPTLREQVEAFERNLIVRMLGQTSGNQSEAARRLGTSRVTLIDKMKKYGLGAATA
jgi:two-component system, NtrC family, response regulator AtoC